VVLVTYGANSGRNMWSSGYAVTLLAAVTYAALPLRK
jgi:hypothetical protein